MSEAMKKGFKMVNPADKLAKSSAAVNTKNKGGRPRTKTEPCKTINIAVPESIYANINIAKMCYGNNMTLYINRLIEKDLEANLNEYQKVADKLKLL